MGNIFDPGKRDRLHSTERQKQLPPGLVLRHLALHPGEVFLDIGAGTGFFAIPAAAELLPGGRVIAADISDEMLEALKRRTSGEPGEFHYVRADIDRIPLDDAVADAILLAFVFHEMQDREKWLLEIHRLLRPEGRAAIVEWDTVSSQGGPPQEERLPASGIIAFGFAIGIPDRRKSAAYSLSLSLSAPEKLISGACLSG